MIQPFSVLPLIFWLLVFLGIARALLVVFPSFRLLEETGRYRQLDGLRGILALGVFFHHGSIHYQLAQTHLWAAPPSVFYAQLGIVSVRFFFFLSGFLFWSKLIQSNGKLHLRKFFSARFWRVVPASWFSIGVIVLVVFVEKRFQIQEKGFELIRNVFSWMVFGLPLSYFPMINQYQETHLINAWVFWTLALEWTFYLILPALGWFSKGNRLFLFIAGLWLWLHYYPHIQLVERIKGSGWEQYLDSFQHFLVYLLNGFCFGMVSAWLRSRYRGGFNFKKPLISLVSLLCLILIFWGNPTEPKVSICLFVFFSSLVFGNSLFGFLETESLVFLGKISFGVYLFHGIILWSLRSFESPDPVRHWLFVGTAGVLTLLVATFVYRNIEYPLIVKK